MKRCAEEEVVRRTGRASPSERPEIGASAQKEVRSFTQEGIMSITVELYFADELVFFFAATALNLHTFYWAGDIESEVEHERAGR